MSIASEFNSYEQALSLIGEMPFADKLRFNTDLATLLRKEGKSGAVGKAAKKEKKSKDPSNKRTAAPGTLAWIAFVKHCKDTMSERFTECTLEKERLAVAKAIKSEDKDVYDAFVVKFKSDHPVVLQGDNSASPSDDEAEDVSPPAPAPTPVPTLSAKEKLEKLKAVSATAALKKTEPKVKAEKPVAAPKAKAEKPKAEPKAKKEVKKAAPKAKAAEKPVEEAAMPKKQIDGTDYWFDPETNGLYNIVDGGFGAWVGYFQPDNKETPIRHTETPSDE
jgi:hypothetical protein